MSCVVCFGCGLVNESFLASRVLVNIRKVRTMASSLALDSEDNYDMLPGDGFLNTLYKAHVMDLYDNGEDDDDNCDNDSTHTHTHTHFLRSGRFVTW